MSIRVIHLVSTGRFRARAAVLVAVPAMAAGGLLAASAPAAYAAPACSVSTITMDISAASAVVANLNSELASLGSTPSPAQVQAVAGSVTGGLNTLSNDLGSDGDSLQGCAALNNADSQAAVAAYSDLAVAIGQMLGALVRVHKTFAQFGLTAPIASALRSFESAFDFFSSALAQLAPSQAGDLTAGQSQVDSATENAVSTYSQICIPSPLYPIVQPICVSL